MIVYWSVGIVIGLLIVLAIGMNVFSARNRHIRLTDDEYVYDLSEGWPREMGPEELGSEAVIQERFRRGEIDEETYQHMIRDLHHPPAA